jgi:hypothetical protein
MANEHPLDRLTVSTRVLKRAQYEAFEFTVSPPFVGVRNHSHRDPSAHAYVVHVRDGLPIRCTCPADERFDGACKHRVAVAIRRLILEEAIEHSVGADGKAVTDTETERTVPEGKRGIARSSTECDCQPGNRLPCWSCAKTGGRSPEPVPDEPTDGA